MSNDFISGFLLAWMMAALWWLGMILWMWFHRDRPLEPAPKDEPEPEPQPMRTTDPLSYGRLTDGDLAFLARGPRRG